MWLYYLKSPGLSDCLPCQSAASAWLQRCLGEVFNLKPVLRESCSHGSSAPYLGPHWSSSKPLPHSPSSQPWAAILLLVVNDLISSLEVLICLIWAAFCFVFYNFRFLMCFLPPSPVSTEESPLFLRPASVHGPSLPLLSKWSISFPFSLLFWLYPSFLQKCCIFPIS